MGFTIPAKRGPNNRIGTVTREGFKTRPNPKSPKEEIIPFSDIKAFIGSDRDLEVVFRDHVKDANNNVRKPLIFLIEDESGHQLLDLERMIETYMLQTKTAVLDDETRETIVNKPEFDMERVTPLMSEGYAFA